MVVGDETIVPEAGFLPYRYLTLAAWTTVGVLSMVWILPLARGAAFTLAWIIFLAWTLLIVATAAAMVVWIPLHAAASGTASRRIASSRTVAYGTIRRCSSLTLGSRTSASSRGPSSAGSESTERSSRPLVRKRRLQVRSVV